MILFANTILGSDLPYFFSLLLSPVILFVETFIVWKRHPQLVVSKGRALMWVFLANAASTLAGLMFTRGGILGVKDSFSLPGLSTAICWAWTMSCVIEYCVLRLAIPSGKATRLAVTCILNNLVSYTLILPFIWKMLSRGSS